MWPDSLTPRVLVASPPPVDTRSGAMAGFDVPGGSAAMPRPERVARLQPGLAGSGSTAAAAGVTRAPAGKTAEDAHSGCDACRGRNAESLEAPAPQDGSTIAAGDRKS